MKEAFTEELQKLPNRKVQRKKLMISIGEILNKDATPKFERLTDNKEAILIAVDELPDQYKDMPALVPDNKDDEEEELTEGDLLIAYLQGESMKPKLEEKEEPLNQPIQVDSTKISIRAKTSISHRHMKQKQMRRNLLRI